VHGLSAYATRRRLGVELARLQPCGTGTVVVAPPGAAVPAAIGFAATAGRGFEQAIEASADGQLHVVRPAVEGQRVVLVVPTLLTGDTARRLVRDLKSAGALAVHVRVASPMVRFSNPYGVASPTREELASSPRETLDTLAAWLDAESIGFLSVEAMHKAVSGNESGLGWCDVAFTGVLPVPAEAPTSQLDFFADQGEAASD
jgi:amidophosphoribosyltransferase